jgi:hypothetical protein
MTITNTFKNRVGNIPLADLDTNFTDLDNSVTSLSNSKANINSPAFTGTPTAPTAATGTNTTQIATTAFAIANGIPSGGIIMWSGSIATIPTGWRICDGTNGTPDLRDRFVMGAGNTYAVAATGGSKDAVVVSHSHTATSTVSDPGHFHSTNWLNINDYNQGSLSPGVEQFPDDQQGSFNINTDSKTTGISVSTSLSTNGVSGTNANLPPYYALAFIMKV